MSRKKRAFLLRSSTPASSTFSASHTWLCGVDGGCMDVCMYMYQRRMVDVTANDKMQAGWTHIHTLITHHPVWYHIISITYLAHGRAVRSDRATG